MKSADEIKDKLLTFKELEKSLKVMNGKTPLTLNYCEAVIEILEWTLTDEKKLNCTDWKTINSDAGAITGPEPKQ